MAESCSDALLNQRVRHDVWVDVRR
eukprot:SAG31_NODE_45252_length_259_cov_1.037500_2_plen_24_part_01